MQKRIKYIVYGIYDNAGHLKYIGCTHQDLNLRLYQILQEVNQFKDQNRGVPFFEFFSNYIGQNKKPLIKEIKSFYNPKKAGEFEYELMTITPNIVNRTIHKHKIYQGCKLKLKNDSPSITNRCECLLCGKRFKTTLGIGVHLGVIHNEQRNNQNTKIHYELKRSI